MKVNTRGLVAVKFVTNHNIYKGGQVAGFSPEIAKKLIGAEIAEEYDPDAPDLPAEPAHASVLYVALEDGTLEIPSDWRKAHHAARINWAKKINPDADDVNAEKANEIIAEAVKDQE